MTNHWPSDRVGKAKLDACVWSVDVDGVWRAPC